jgi:hypothetical protein
MKLAAMCLVLPFLLSVGANAHTGSPPAKAACVNPKLATKEESYMFGRVLAAIEDLGGGYNTEALHRYASIVKDIEKRDYHPCLRWMAYDGYGESLTIAKKKDKAIAALTRAVEVANTLGDSEREESARHIEAAQQLK